MKLKSDGAVRYSPGEQRIFALLREDPRDTAEIADLYYGAEIPFNGRHIVIGLLAALIRKTEANNEPFQIMKTKRAGPHPMAFWINKNKHSTTSPRRTAGDASGSEQSGGTVPKKKSGVERNELLVVFPSGKSIKDNVRLDLSYEWASKPCKRNQRFIGLYDKKTIERVGKVEAITVAFYKDGNVEYPEKPEAGRLTADHQTRIERAFTETLVFPIRDGRPRRFYLVDRFCRTHAIKTSPGPVPNYQYFDLSDFNLSKVAYKPNKDSKDYTSEEMAKALEDATWE